MSDATKHVVLLVGSPKGLEKSRSSRLARPVVDGLERRGWTSESLHLHAEVATEEGRERLLGAVDRADLILFAAPLYVDSLPAPAIRGLELIAARQRTDGVERAPRFVSILCCGFVEPSQNDTCQRILQRFADQAGFEWVTGVSLGGGGPISKRARSALGILTEALDLEILVPDEVDRLTRKPAMPRWLYIIGGNVMWRRWAKEYDARDRLRDRPYRRPDS